MMKPDRKTSNPSYDIIVVGAGVVGAAAARALSRYSVRLLVIEKESDVGSGSSSANSAIVHSGYDPVPGSLKARLNVRGNRLFSELCRELDVDLKWIGSLTLALADEDVPVIEELEKRGVRNGVPVEILDRAAALRAEPNLSPGVRCALWAPSAGIVNPFELCVGLVENALENGAQLRLDEKVLGVVPLAPSGYEVRTNRGRYRGKVVINAAGVYADEVANGALSEAGLVGKYGIRPRRGEYFVLDHFDPDYLHHTIFTVPSAKGKGILVSPTTHGNYLVGPSAEFVEEKDDCSTSGETLANVLSAAQKMVPSIPMRQIIRQFSGIRAVESRGDFVIDQPLPGLINLLGIQSPGLTAAPAIAEEAVKMAAETVPLEEKPDYRPCCRPRVRLHRLSPEERAAFVRENPLYGHIVCRCEDVSEGEIIDAVRRRCGARTVDGVKRRVRPGFGKCQGGFCQPEVIRILARELGVSPEQVRKGSAGSYILAGPMGGETP